MIFVLFSKDFVADVGYRSNGLICFFIRFLCIAPLSKRSGKPDKPPVVELVRSGLANLTVRLSVIDCHGVQGLIRMWRSHVTLAIRGSNGQWPHGVFDLCNGQFGISWTTQ